MYFNIDQIPAGTHLYTIYVTVDPMGTARSEMCAEEVDVTCEPHHWGGGQFDPANYGKVHPTGEHVPEYLMGLYSDDVRIIGIVDQSDGFVKYDAFKAGDETGADDL